MCKFMFLILTERVFMIPTLPEKNRTLDDLISLVLVTVFVHGKVDNILQSHNK